MSDPSLEVDWSLFDLVDKSEFLVGEANASADVNLLVWAANNCDRARHFSHPCDTHKVEKVDHGNQSNGRCSRSDI